MNNPDALPIDVARQRDWLNEHKADMGYSWAELAPKIGVKVGTISPFAVGKYVGDNEKIAEAIVRYQQTVLSQADLEIELPYAPEYFETTTTSRITAALRMAQGSPGRSGRMTMVAGRPGTSKTVTCKQYKATRSSVFLATMKPTTKRVNTMQLRVAEALGGDVPKGAPLILTRHIEKTLRDTGGLLIIDEAHYLEDEAFQEIRGWHDETGVGICLVGNDDVIDRIMTGTKRDAFASLASRVAYNLKIHAPLEADALAQADAWNITDDAVRQHLVRLSRRDGGLRTCSRALELAGGLAIMDGGPITVDHLTDAAASLPQKMAA